LAGRGRLWVAFVTAGSLLICYDLGIWGVFGRSERKGKGDDEEEKDRIQSEDSDEDVLAKAGLGMVLESENGADKKGKQNREETSDEESLSKIELVKTVESETTTKNEVSVEATHRDVKDPTFGAREYMKEELTSQVVVEEEKPPILGSKGMLQVASG